MNNKGTNQILTIIITAIITAAICYICFTLIGWSNSLNGNTDADGNNLSSSETKKTGWADLLSGKSDDDSNSSKVSYSLTQFKKLDTLKRIIDAEYLYDYKEEELIDNAASGMLTALDDPYAVYYNQEQFKNFYTQTEGEYVGIGIYVAFDKVRNMPIVLLPLDNSPALEAGVEPGDYIEYVEDMYADSTNYEALIDAIKGKAGTKVKIGFIRIDDNKEEKSIELEVERRKIEINPIESKVYEENIGYIRLTSFDETSYNNFRTEYEKLLNESRVKGLIIDLRDNPGGVLAVCAKITDLIVPEGKIVYTVDKKGTEEPLFSDKQHIEIPLVVLVNENSASASEVFTGAVKDYGVGTIIGKTTYGKGVVQTLKSLKDGTYVKLTTAEYFSPKGNKINGQGVTPDIEVDLPEKVKNSYNIEFEDDTQLQRAIEELKNKI